MYWLYTYACSRKTICTSLSQANLLYINEMKWLLIEEKINCNFKFTICLFSLIISYDFVIPWKFSSFLKSNSSAGWWHWACLCCWCSFCSRVSFNCCQWGFRGVRANPCTWNSRLFTRTEGLSNHILSKTNAYRITIHNLALIFVDARSKENWKGSSNWNFIDCCWWGNICRFHWVSRHCEFSLTFL